MRLQDIKRAYRGLAQVFHPDKHLDDDLRDKAQEAFAKLQVCTAEMYSSTVHRVPGAGDLQAPFRTNCVFA